ncbi:MAG: hypothetical protein KGJ55_07075 [Gammaproteobacteria bacterium]|nr:hypothetical protein [Gammaproteobacteria bacterium]
MNARRLLIAVSTALLLLGAAQWWLQRYAEQRLQQALSALRPWVAVDVGRARFWLWGRVDLRRIAVTPRAWYAASYGLPLGYSMSIAHVSLRRLRPTLDGGLRLSSADVDLHDVHLPLPDWGWNIAVARAANGRRLPAPTLRELGVAALDLDLAVRLRWPHGWRRPRLYATTAIPDLGRAHLSCDLDTGAARLGAPDRLVVNDCRLRYDDAGLVLRFERRMARDNDMTLPALRDAIVRQIALDAARAHRPPLNTVAVRAFVRAPSALELRIVPPRPLALGSIPRAVWPGLPAYLGLTAGVPPAAGGDPGD